MNKIKITISRCDNYFSEDELMNSKSELLRVTYNNIKKNNFSDNSDLTLVISKR